jgi:tetrahydromethanopterin S-methyltransferase subunit G
MLPAMSSDTAMSFDRMRGMLNRAAEIRESEQQQVFDSLDEIHARLAALDALGTMRKRLTDLPDRTEVGVLAERLDETVAKLDAQDAVLAAVTRALEALPDRLAKPFAQLDGRLDGMAGRMEGISGRMDGLDDRLGGLHKRLDELDHRLDRHEMRLDAMPSSVGTPLREKIDGVERTVRERLDATDRAVDENAEGVRNLLGDTGVGLHRRLEELAARPAVDPTAPLDGLAQRLESLASRLDGVAAHLDTVDNGLGARIGTLGGSLEERLGRLEAVLGERPDATTLSSLVERAHTRSEMRNGAQLDEAMATFAELILGRGTSVQQPPPPPRPTQRRTPRAKVGVKSSNGSSPNGVETLLDDPDE